MISESPSHSVTWEISFDGKIIPTFSCEYRHDSPCFSFDGCGFVNYVTKMVDPQPMDLYRPTLDDRNKPADGPIHAWYSPVHDAWHWKYPSPPYTGPTIDTGGLLEHLTQGQTR